MGDAVTVLQQPVVVRWAGWMAGVVRCVAQSMDDRAALPCGRVVEVCVCRRGGGDVPGRGGQAVCWVRPLPAGGGQGRVCVCAAAGGMQCGVQGR